MTANNIELFKLVISHFHSRQLPFVTQRDYPITVVPGKILALTGPRRSGKTFYLYQCMHQLLANDTAMTNLLYVNFEDERLYPLAANELGTLLEAYFALYPQKKNERIYLFLDEIQNIPGWERFVRRVLDTERVQIYVTGSSSHLLSREIATALRGRTITSEIFPFSFGEYLRSLHIDPSSRDSQTLANIQHAMTTYLQRGGFPEVLHAPETMWRPILHDYLNLVIYKDLIDRYRIKNQQLVRYLIRTFLRNIAAPYSIQKLYRDLKSQGFRVGKDTLHQYVRYLEDVYCLFTIPICSESLRIQHVNYRKAYAIDIGFASIVTTGLSERRGQLLENLVYLHLLRQRDREIYYYKTHRGHEVDFVVVEQGAIAHLIQVTESLDDPATRDRELPALWEAMHELKIHAAVVVTRESQEEIRQGKLLVKVIPAARWLLDDHS